MAKIQRQLKTINEFFDIMNNLPLGKFISFGYVTGANLDVPKVNRRNPETNRMKGYPDYETAFGSDDIKALIKITSYTIPYAYKDNVMKRYNKYKNDVNDIRAKYGAPAMGDKAGYTQRINYGDGNISMYSGDNEELKNHTYISQNTKAAVRISSYVYTLNQEGKIMDELTPEQVRPYLNKRQADSGETALRKMGADELQIQSYIKEIDSLNFSYREFESNSLLWVTGTTKDGEPIAYINTKFKRFLKSENINVYAPDIIEKAQEHYTDSLDEIIELNTNMSEEERLRNNYEDFGSLKTEAKLYRMIRESIRDVLLGY